MLLTLIRGQRVALEAGPDTVVSIVFERRSPEISTSWPLSSSSFGEPVNRI
jgi:hypothetical protein